MTDVYSPLSHERKIEIARKHVERGMFEQAQVVLKEVLDADAQSPDALELVADIAMLAGEMDKVHAILTTLLARDPSNPKHLKAMAQLNAAQGELESARKCIEIALEKAPDDPSARIIYASILNSLGDPNEAAEQAGQALQLDDQQAEAFHVLGNALFALGNMPAAANSYDRSLALMPGNPDVLKNLAALLRLSGQFEPAARVLREALLWVPGLAPLHIALAETLILAGAWEEGIAQTKTAVDASPKEAAIQLAAARLYRVAGAFKESLRAAQIAARELPDEDGPLVELTRTFLAGGDDEAAEKTLASLQARFAKNPELRLMRGEIALGKGDVHAAFSDFDTAFERIRTKRGRWLDRISVLKPDDWVVVVAEDWHEPDLLGARLLPRLRERCRVSIAGKRAPLIRALFSDPNERSAEEASGDAFVTPISRLLGLYAQSEPEALASLATSNAGIPEAGREPARLAVLRERTRAAFGDDLATAVQQVVPYAQVIDVPGERADRDEIDDFIVRLRGFERVIASIGWAASFCGALGIPATVFLPPEVPWWWRQSGAVTVWYPSLAFVRMERPTPSHAEILAASADAVQ